jgi:Tol biopolymer transport system component
VSAPAPKKWLWPVVAGAAVLAVGVTLAVWAPWRRATQTESLQSVRFEVAQTDAMQFIYGGAMAVSPDGHWLVFPARGEDGVVRYWLRSLDTVEARALPGTEGAFVPAAWTYDSRYIVFSPLGSSPTPMTPIKKVDIQGGPPQVLGEMVGSLNGATSSKEGVILFGSSRLGSPVFRVPAAGGAVVPVTVVAEGDVAHRYPQFLPDGRRFLYLRVSPDPDKMGVYLGSIDAGPDAQSHDRLLATTRQAYYAARPGGGPGHLIYLRDGTLMAQPFDPDRLTLSGEASPIAEGVESYAGQSYGMFSVSDSGTLAYRSGVGDTLSVTWLDQTGRVERVLGEPGEYANPAVSPDASRIAVALGKAGARDIWIVDAARNTTRRFTFDPANDDNPVWSPDGTTIAFSSNRRGQTQLYMKPADGLGEERLMTDQPGVPTSWSKDGRYLLFTVTSAKTFNDIWVLPEPQRGDVKPFEVIATGAIEDRGQFSPDARWIAYVAQLPNTGVIVRPFSPNAGAGATEARYLVSRGIAHFPRWRADGAQLFYITGVLDLMAVEINTKAGFQAGTPQRLFGAPPPLLPVGWSVAPSGDRFLFVTTPDGGKPAPFRVVVNWASALNR